MRKASRGRYAVVAGRRRYLALAQLAEAGRLDAAYAVPCRVLDRETDAAEISLAENIVRAPMHPADQFEAFAGWPTAAPAAARSRPASG